MVPGPPGTNGRTKGMALRTQSARSASGTPALAKSAKGISSSLDGAVVWSWSSASSSALAFCRAAFKTSAAKRCATVPACLYLSRSTLNCSWFSASISWNGAAVSASKSNGTSMVLVLFLADSKAAMVDPPSGWLAHQQSRAETGLLLLHRFVAIAAKVLTQGFALPD